MKSLKVFKRSSMGCVCIQTEQHFLSIVHLFKLETIILLFHSLLAVWRQQELHYETGPGHAGIHLKNEAWPGNTSVCRPSLNCLVYHLDIKCKTTQNIFCFQVYFSHINVAQYSAITTCLSTFEMNICRTTMMKSTKNLYIRTFS